MRFVALLSLAAFAAHPAIAETSVAGDWLVEHGSAKVRIGPCAEKPDHLCGMMVWLKNPKDPTGRPARDGKNPDPKLRDRTLVGLSLLTNLTPAGERRWGGGQIYDPTDGKTYKSKFSLAADGHLRVSGCVFVVCVTQTWTRP